MMRSSVRKLNRPSAFGFNRAATLGGSADFPAFSFINGEFVPASSPQAVVEVRNPATDEILGVVPNHGKTEVNRAIESAAAAQEKWAAVAPQRKAELLRAWRDQMHAHNGRLAKILTSEAGKPIAEAKGENLYSANYVDWYAGEAERIYGDIIPSPRPGVRTTVQKTPIGVVGVITPWNFPLAMITRTVAGALAAGCSVVLKPSELTPYSALALCELAQDCGIPDGLINVINGEAPPIGDAIMESDTVRKFSFTGSTRVGKLLMSKCADTVKKVAMELGGNAPLVVFDDAELDIAVPQAIAAKFRNAGQTCVCANRIFVQRGIADEFTKKFTEAVQAMKVGNGLDEGVTMGPLINRAAVDRIDATVQDAVSKGATLLAGGKRVEGKGYFYEPTVLSNVNHDWDVCQNELFGPVAPIVQFETEEEVLKLANSTTAGLAGYFFTTDYRRQWRFSEKLKFGMVGINEGGISTPVAPFGGMKESGIGRDGSKYGIDAFLDVRYILHGGKL